MDAFAWGSIHDCGRLRALATCGRQVQPARTDWRRDPFALYSERGLPLYAWYDGCYPWRFRPDNE
jgi:hypothetical protein